MNDAVGLVSASFKAHDIEIALDAPEDFYLEGFPNEYAQVLLNLLGNAKEAILQRNIRHGRVAIRLWAEHGEARLSLADNGGGIAAEAWNACSSRISPPRKPAPASACTCPR
ncbi:HAMP domain-containing histidine kinase [Methylogaea oryzae]|uniref:HAMP domain-containing histidine kinase n=1 Tax=Methylogaea oryzae TaxID=1295382 RepID=UPI0006D0583B|nr:HAMP domain-containing histidine kinase [Methylogaea oryzae]